MTALLVRLSLTFAIQTVFLFIALLVMIKIQKLEWNFLDLLVAAVVGSGLDMIPFVGHYLAVIALWFCIKKTTNGDLFPDVAFTVGIGYALVFCLNLFVIGSLLGNLRPSARNAEPASQKQKQKEKVKVVAAAKVDEEPKPPAPKESTNVVALPSPEPAPPRQPAVTPAGNSAREISRIFSIRGVIESSDKPVLTLHSGMRTYTVIPGETRAMETQGGRVNVRFDGVRDHQVLLTISGEQVALYYQ